MSHFSHLEVSQSTPTPTAHGRQAIDLEQPEDADDCNHQRDRSNNGSDHEWFEDRGPRCTLLVYIDDATSKLLVHLKFVESESAMAYFRSTREYIETYGKPVAFYSDKHSVFRVAPKKNQSTQGLTQFGRALEDLNIEIICANTSQAKGRVERVNRTLQN